MNESWKLLMIFYGGLGLYLVGAIGYTLFVMRRRPPEGKDKQGDESGPPGQI